MVDGQGQSPPPWQAPPQDLTLGEGEVHVWRARLDGFAGERAPLWHTLCQDERERAACFYFERDRQRFVAGRALLRMILAGYLECKPEEIDFQYSARGKPLLGGLYEASGIQFNVAHSHELALYAVARRRLVGVDVEYHRQLDDAEGIARRFFSIGEVAALLATPETGRHHAFFEIWTRKEAYIKAIGQGLAQPLAAFDVMDGPQQPAAFVRFAQPDGNGPWLLRDLAPGAHYSAALVVEGTEVVLRCWDATLPILSTMRNN